MFRFHVFVCTQQKAEGLACCAAAGSIAVADRLAQEIQKQGLDRQAQLTTCTCMGLCEEGPVVVVYPEGIWYRRVQPGDVPEIVASHLGKGGTVKRLEWADAEARQALTLEHAAKFRAATAARDEAGTLPDSLTQLVRGFMPSRCLLTALELDLFSAVGNGATAKEVATTTGASVRGVDMLLNALVALGLMTKDGDVIRNSAVTARYFTRGSKDNHREGLLHMADIWPNWSNLTQSVQSGERIPIEPAASEARTRNFIAGMQHNAKDRAIHAVRAIGTAGVRRVLDLGGGSGIYSIAFAKASPEIRCEILDLPQVVPLTTGYVETAGVASQVAIRTGSMLEGEFGTGIDIIMLNAICHIFSPQQDLDLFRRARRALSKGGRLVVQDFILNPDKTGPAHAALFSLNMLVCSDAGASYNEAEYTNWMTEAGFSRVEHINLPGPSDLIVGHVD